VVERVVVQPGARFFRPEAVKHIVHSSECPQETGSSSWQRTCLIDLTHVALALPGVDRVAIRHDAANAASAAVAAKAGFTEVERISREPVAAGETGTDIVRERRA
jgi:hypothetical protein